MSSIHAFHVPYARALLPDLIQLAYIPRDQLRINSDSQNVEVDQRRRRERSPDYTMFTMNSQIYSPGTSTQPHEDEHVLVLDFAAGRVAGKKPENPSVLCTIYCPGSDS